MLEKFRGRGFNTIRHGYISDYSRIEKRRGLESARDIYIGLNFLFLRFSIGLNRGLFSKFKSRGLEVISGQWFRVICLGLAAKRYANSSGGLDKVVAN